MTNLITIVLPHDTEADVTLSSNELQLNNVFWCLTTTVVKLAKNKIYIEFIVTITRWRPHRQGCYFTSLKVHCSYNFLKLVTHSSMLLWLNIQDVIVSNTIVCTINFTPDERVQAIYKSPRYVWKRNKKFKIISCDFTVSYCIHKFFITVSFHYTLFYSVMTTSQTLKLIQPFYQLFVRCVTNYSIL